LLLLALVYLCPVVEGQRISGRVVKVSDGDTFTLLDENNSQIRVRLYGIDCPEKGQDFGERARLKTAEYIAGKTVSVDVIDTDRYGRKVGIVHVGGSALNEILVTNGLAWNYEAYNKLYLERYRNIERQARAARIGLWSQSNPVAPWEYRRGSSSKSEDTKKTAERTKPDLKSQKVIICLGKSAYTYHRHSCGGLSRCRSGTATITVSDAKSRGYRPCKICY
jgi:endonuclease YncB( thermonuclease family)